eukprot:TRINITY_DN27367_c0_g1_i2.p1 TRINITY_DN27367_c0_g1~~TRINITY_DN27367_c0_g1_i2.p1  ORF type:complete len:286 (-),score=51.27 TRINITY_DN27367_c0_g1_i2:24-785(-)
MASVVWLFILLMIILVLLGLVFMTAAVEFVRSGAGDDRAQKDMMTWFGNLPAAVLNLFKVMAGGMEWEKMGDTLMSISVIYGLLLVMYVGFAVFGIANVATGVFVENAHATREKIQKEDELLLANSVANVIEEIDAEKKGYITTNEFSAALVDNSRFLRFCDAVQLDHTEVLRVFYLLDTYDEDFVPVVRLTRAFSRFTGNLKNTDLVMLFYEIRRLGNDFHNFCCFVEGSFRSLAQAVGMRVGAQRYRAARA